MKRFIIAIFFILTFISQMAVAQGYNTKPGFIVTISNDTIKGNIKERNMYRNMVEFSEGDRKFREYSPGELNSFVIEGKKLYRSIEVEEDSINKRRIFLLTLVEGMISLYYCEDNFFIAKKNGIYYKIEKNQDITKKITEGPQEAVRTILIEDKRYIGTFKVLTQDCPKVFSRTDNLQYDSKSFTRLVREYNTIMNPQQVSVVTDDAFKVTLKIGVRGTFLINDMDNFPDDGRYRDENFEAKECFSAGVVANISVKQKFSLQPELLITQRRGYLYRENLYGAPPEILDFNLFYLEFPFIVYYTFPTKKISPSVFAGPLIGSKIIDNSEIQTIYSTKIGMENLEYGIRAGAGVTLKRLGSPFIRLEYYYERTLTNVYSTEMRYHQLANNFSATFFFY